MISEATQKAGYTPSAATLERFAREVAKYPPDQKQSAVMACLSIVQQEQGWVSAEAEQAVADYLGMPTIAVGLTYAPSAMPCRDRSTGGRNRARTAANADPGSSTSMVGTVLIRTLVGMMKAAGGKRLAVSAASAIDCSRAKVIWCGPA